MGKIIKRLELIGDQGHIRREVLFDSGATESLIRRDVAEPCSTLHPLPQPRHFVLGDGKTALEATHAAIVSLRINGTVIDGLFYVLERMGKAVVLGAPTMQMWDIRLNLKQERVSVGENPNALEF